MPQNFTHHFNKTVYGVLNHTASPPDSLSVRLTNISKWSYGKIYGISFGLCPPGATSILADEITGELLILRNERFDPGVAYRLSLLAGGGGISARDVAYHWPFIKGPGAFGDVCKALEFPVPLELKDASDYLIIMPAPLTLSTPSDNADCSLTVRGEICSVNGADLEPK